VRKLEDASVRREWLWYTLSQSMILRTFGRVTPQVLDHIRSLLGEPVAEKM
jgi:hypothetical protein